MSVWVRRVNCVECGNKFTGGCQGHWIDGDPIIPSAPPTTPTIWIPESDKQRLERIATAVLAGMGEIVWADQYQQNRAVPVAVAAARALLAALDSEAGKP